MLVPPNPTYPEMPKLDPDIILRVWDCNFEVPSIDPDCLILMTLLKLYNIKATISYASLPLFCNIPSLHYNDIVITKGPLLLPYVMNKICREDKKISQTHLQIIQAYKTYFIDYFAQIFIFNCWIDEENFNYGFETWFNDIIPYPFANKYVKDMRKRIQRKFNNILGYRNQDKYMSECYETAQICLSDFDSLLKDKRNYLWRNIPTSLDAVVYSYLVIALHIPSCDSVFRRMIERHKRLLHYIQVITKNHFPNTPNKRKYARPVNRKSDMIATQYMILASLFTGSCTIMYGYCNGLISLKIPNYILEFDILDYLAELDYANFFFDSILLPFALFIE